MDSSSCAAFAGAIPFLLVTGVLDQAWVEKNRLYGNKRSRGAYKALIGAAMFGLWAALWGTLIGGFHGYFAALVIIPAGITTGALMMILSAHVEPEADA
ncbi:hypothetical protein [Rhodococcus sp. SBT000017]|uniref:hypothetical protein n=1 Tax=Rhodococcus sp. SBT000017 TaxID=1803385 RepID=UPI0011C46CEE|nr:hypothetical protein [Rhodococcus sp. SBT000017]